MPKINLRESVKFSSVYGRTLVGFVLGYGASQPGVVSATSRFELLNGLIISFVGRYSFLLL